MFSTVKSLQCYFFLICLIFILFVAANTLVGLAAAGLIIEQENFLLEVNKMDKQNFSQSKSWISHQKIQWKVLCCLLLFPSLRPLL